MRGYLWVMGLLLLLLAACAAPAPVPDNSLPRAPRPLATATVELVTLLPRDGIQAILEPTFLSAAEADAQVGPQDEVIGVEINGDARAYPLRVLYRHEIVNDTVGGVPVAVTFCPLCYTGMVYERRVAGRTLTFGVSGKIALNALVMYDHETGSLWGQVIGHAIEGPLTGTPLSFRTATQTTWQQWLLEHPDTRLLDGGPRQGNPYQAYLNDATAGVLGLGEAPVFAVKDYVIGVALENEAVAYPFETLRRERVVNDQVASTPAALFFDPASGAGTVWERPLHNNAPLTFTSAGDEGFQVKDEQTGTIWSGSSGRAISGPLAGQQLVKLPSTYSFWYGWVDWYPKTRVFRSKP